MNSTKRSLMRVFEDLGLEVVNTEMTGSNHYKFTTINSNGETRFFIAPNTPSDHRSMLNFRAEVKRWKRREETLP